MEGILEKVRRSTRRAATAAARLPGVPSSVALLMPGREAGEYLLCRRLPSAAPTDAGPEATTRQTFPSLEAAAASLTPDDTFVVTLPVELGLVQRMALPAAEPSELDEMVRIQLEKILPYPAESVDMATQEIARTETDVTLAVESVHQDRLIELCQPLVSRDCWPRKVAFHTLVLAASGAPDENTAFIHREGGKFVLSISEGGKLSFAQALGGQTAEDLATELPAVLLGAELEGVPSNFASVQLDERAADWKDTLAAALGIPVVTFDPEGAALLSAPRPEGDLSPDQWQAERQRGERRARLRRQVKLAAAIYGGLLLVGLLALGVRKIQVAYFDSRLAKVRPQAAYSRDANARWRTLAPAVEPDESLVEVMKNVYDCLPPGDVVLLTGFDYVDQALTVQAEASSSTTAAEFAEKLKAAPRLRAFHLDAPEPPVLLPNNGKWRIAVKTNRSQTTP